VHLGKSIIIIIFPVYKKKKRFGIAPRVLDKDGKARIEVFNPCDDSDD
jgi:hypothetical protein